MIDLNRLNDLSYKLRRVRKVQPQKNPQVDAIFEQLETAS
jgi:hypothetical protein